MLYCLISRQQRLVRIFIDITAYPSRRVDVLISFMIENSIESNTKTLVNSLKKKNWSTIEHCISKLNARVHLMQQSLKFIKTWPN